LIVNGNNGGGMPEIVGLCSVKIVVIGLAIFVMTPLYFVFINIDESAGTVSSLMA
jgi:hypothetical protein